jgi:hypothetical protein
MTIYGSPGGTPNNTPPFQGTTPGNAVGTTLTPINPGVGMFPPGSNTLSGDSVMASISRGTLPANQDTSGFGIINSSGGRPITNCMSDSNPANGSAVAIVLNGGSPNGQACGGAALGAGGMNQTQTPGGGCAHPLPHSMPVANLTLTAGPQYQG